MKAKNILAISTAALATAAITVATFSGGSSEAGGDGATPSLRIAVPALVAHGVTMTLTAPGGRVFKAGEQPAFQLTAVNGTNQSATVCVSITMNSASLESMMSRVPRAPSVIWQDQRSFTLKAGETREFTVPANTNLPPNTMISVLLREVDPAGKAAAGKSDSLTSFTSIGTGNAASQGICALSFSTFTNTASAPAIAFSDH